MAVPGTSELLALSPVVSKYTPYLNDSQHDCEGRRIRLALRWRYGPAGSRSVRAERSDYQHPAGIALPLWHLRRVPRRRGRCHHGHGGQAAADSCGASVHLDWGLRDNKMMMSVFVTSHPLEELPSVL